MTLRAASKLMLVWAGVAVTALFEHQIMTSSQPFDVVTCDEPQPPAPPPSPPPSTDSQLVTLGSLPPSSFDRCEPIFKWVELERGRRSVSVRLDVSREGIKEGWAIRVDLQTRGGAAVAVDNLIGALLHSEAGGQLLLLPRMASGLGTLTMDVRLAGGGDAAAISAAPLVTCERAPEMPVQPADAWKRSARADYAWMSKEFNRQYLNSHGIAVHPDFRPDAAKAEKDLYALNGRLWCFYGAVHNATRALGEAIRLDPTNFRTMVLLAKIQIGRGRHVEALEALDAAAALEERHWQVHLLRLHCLRRLGRLAEPEAEPSHRVVCGTLGAACASVGLERALPLLCSAGRVRFLFDDAVDAQAALEAPAGRKGRGGGSRRTGGGSAALTVAEPFPNGTGAGAWPMGAGPFGEQLHGEAARRKLVRDRYTVLRGVFPPLLLTLLQRWYAYLREDVGANAKLMEKNRRHEYNPEVISSYLNLALVPFASRMSSSVVAPTYPFPITYIPGGGIHPHLDVSDNELSLTFQVGIEDADVWPIAFLDPRGQDLSNLDASGAKWVDLDDNDGIIYYGPDIVHWRPNMDATLTMIVFAFREEDDSHCNNQ